MLTVAQNKALDALEYALAVIEQYDQEFQKRSAKEQKGDKKKEDQGKSVELSSRLNDVKYNYKELFNLQRERAVDFVKNSRVYQMADERINFNDKFERSYAYTTEMYSSLNTQLVVPIQDKIVLVYDTSLKKASLIVENIREGNFTQLVGERYNDAKVTLSKNWMKLDLNNDGKVTASDLLNAIRNIRLIVAQSQIAEKAWELQESFRRRAITYLQGESNENKNAKEEVPLVKVGDDSNSSDSIELQNLSEKDD